MTVFSTAWPMLSVQDEIYLYLALPSHPALQDTSCLDQAERTRASAFRFAHDRSLYEAAHVCLRLALSQHAPLAPQDWRFSHNAWGKPFIANPEVTGWYFNLAHTQGMIALVISRDSRIGVDVEHIRPIDQLPGLCTSVLKAEEQADVLAIIRPIRSARSASSAAPKKACRLRTASMGNNSSTIAEIGGAPAVSARTT